MSVLSGYLIVLEGIDGSGKTTIAKALVAALNSAHIKALYTYEPYNPDFIEMIKKYGKDFGGVMEALLMAVDRYYHVEKVVKPYLSMGYSVVSDRYVYSSLAYQGARGVSLEWIETLNKFAPKPSLAIYLDVSPEEGLKRKLNVATRIKYMEEDPEFLHRVREVYKRLVNSGFLIEVDASRKYEVVFQDCVNIVCKKLGLLCQ